MLGVKISGGRTSGPAMTAKVWARSEASWLARSCRLSRRARAVSPNSASRVETRPAVNRSRRMRSARSSP
uniref:Uncharacterized protein n=1 Tax=Phenylobacterium glaciei TaxID=2803784 RepID=A0A974P3Q9_9CAUL|nr:hypothetical protein JKL49_01905 [Phenylobacterium glaciei]